MERIVSRELVDPRVRQGGFSGVEDAVRISAGSERVPLAGFVTLSSTPVSPKLCDVRDSRFDVPPTMGPLSTVPMFCSAVIVAGRTDACQSACCIRVNVLLS